MARREGLTTNLRAGLSILARIVAVAVTAAPMLRKFLVYPDMVAQFEVWGLPWPELTVLLAGSVQLLAIATITLGLCGRFGAGSLAVVMVVAMATAGPNPLNGLVFVASVGIAVLGTGPYSLWDPAPSDVTRLAQRSAPRAG